MKKIDKYHEQNYDMFLVEYAEKNNKTTNEVNDEVDYYKAIEMHFPMIEVYFKDGSVYSVNRVTETTIAWEEGNDFWPGQTGFETRFENK